MPVYRTMYYFPQQVRKKYILKSVKEVAASLAPSSPDSSPWSLLRTHLLSGTANVVNAISR